MYGLRWEEEEEAKNFLITVQPSPLGFKEGHKALPGPTPLSRVERYILKKTQTVTLLSSAVN